MGSLITDASIKAALRKIHTGGKTAITLSDAGPRGSGRLLLVVKPERAEWYARRFEAGKSRLKKLGTYPAMPLAVARDRFRAAGVAERNEPAPGNGATLGDMCDAYVARLKADGAATWKGADRLLSYSADVIGRDKPAGDVQPADIVQAIKPIFDRGARVQADKCRMWLGAAFRWAAKSTHDYRIENARDWGVKFNPVESVPRDTDAEGVGNRWLSWQEYDHLFGWLMDQGPGRTPVDRALLLTMLTGQRITAILKLRAENWNSEDRLITWTADETKIGLPHVLPIGTMGLQIMETLKPGPGGWLFPNESGPETHMPHGTARMRIKRYCKRFGVASFTTRDLRRTWKTLAGEAGLSKDDRDRLQHHVKGDVSSVHYDRYEYLREKREAVAKWESWLLSKMKKTRR